jgi:hypothetical protein
VSAAVKMLRELAALRFQHALDRAGRGQDANAGLEAALLEVAGSICAVGAELVVALERQAPAGGTNEAAIGSGLEVDPQSAAAAFHAFARAVARLERPVLFP